MAVARKSIARVIVVGVLACSFSCKPMYQWSRADEFRAGLRCGMFVHEVTALAQRYGAKVRQSESSRADGLQAYWVEQRNTRFYFGFQGGALVKVQQAYGYGMTGLELLPEENLCSTAVQTRLLPAIAAAASHGMTI